MSEAYREPLAGLRALVAQKRATLEPRIRDLRGTRELTPEESRHIELPAAPDEEETAASLVELVRRLEEITSAVDSMVVDPVDPPGLSGDDQPPFQRTPLEALSALSAAHPEQIIAVAGEDVGVEVGTVGVGSSLSYWSLYFTRDTVPFVLEIREFMAPATFARRESTLVRALLTVRVPHPRGELDVHPKSVLEALASFVGFSGDENVLPRGFRREFSVRGDPASRTVLDRDVCALLCALANREPALRVERQSVSLRWSSRADEHTDAFLPERAVLILLAVHAMSSKIR